MYIFSSLSAALAVGLFESAVQLWEIYPFICCGYAQMHPTTHHFYFILLVSHSAGWLNRIMSLTIIINQNYGLKKWRQRKLLTRTSSRRGTPKRSSVMRERGGWERICIHAVEAMMTLVNSQWQTMPDFKPFEEQITSIQKHYITFWVKLSHHSLELFDNMKCL